MARRAPPGAAVLDRQVQHRHLPERTVFVCEGKTEEALLNALRQRRRIAHARVLIVGEAGDPRAILERAQEERTKAGRNAVIVVVFDRDEHAHWAAALAGAQQRGFIAAVSNPCFELWAIFLHEECRWSLSRKDAQKRLQEIHPGYHHERSPFLDVEVVEPLLAVANARARQSRADAERLNEPHRSPTSSFDLAIEALLGPISR